MFTDKKNILQLTALLRAHGIRRIVICPGSRNIPLAQTFANVPEFVCYPMTDERSRRTKRGLLRTRTGIARRCPCSCMLHLGHCPAQPAPSRG